MVKAGMVDEIREFFVPGADNTKGIRRAIGVPELDSYFETETKKGIDDGQKEEILKEAIRKTKQNTFILAENQLSKIQNMADKLGSMINKINSTLVFEAILRGENYQNLHQEIVIKPSMKMVKRFLDETSHGLRNAKYSNGNGKHVPNRV